MFKQMYPYYVGGAPEESGETLAVTDKFSGNTVSSVYLADAAAVERAIQSAVNAAPPLRRMATYQREAILLETVARLEKRAEEFAQVMCIEAGKPIKDARVEVTRAIDTFRIAAAEATRQVGERLSLDTSPRTVGYEGVVKRVPIGPCTFITPFNFPLNLVAHKVAPALAVGCPFILKTPPQSPITAILMAEILAELELPVGAFSVLPCSNEVASRLVDDDRIKLLSFTGSSDVGWMLKSRAGKKKVALELGGNAACIVDQDADIDHAASRIAFGAFYQSGQSCISVQRLIVHRSVYDAMRERLIAAAIKLIAGDPRNEDTFLGPLISTRDVDRVDEWVREAVQAGGKLLCGGKRISDGIYAATIVEDAPFDSRLWCEEVFGPVMTLHAFDSFDQAIELANQSRYGLQTGVFTNNAAHVQTAWDELEVGGVIINDVPSMRVDSMPYGGVKDSGLGREGVRYAMQEMSEMRLLVTNNG